MQERILLRAFRGLSILHALLAPCFVVAGAVISALSERAPGMGEVIMTLVYVAYAAISALVSGLAALYLRRVARRSALSRGQLFRGALVAAASTWWSLRAALACYDILG